jgi:hypothetical protein
MQENEAFHKRAQTRLKKEQDKTLLALYDDIRERHELYAWLIHLLAAFAFYSGVGMYSGQGMGMTRRIER